MLYLLLSALLVHGLLHLAGFSKAFDIGISVQLKSEISPMAGVFWLLASFLFITSVTLKVFDINYWWICVLVALLLSQVLIFTAWHDAKYGTILNLIFLIIIIPFGAASQFESKFKNDVEDQLAKSLSTSDSVLTEDDIQSLPEPVKKYIRHAGAIGQPKVNNFNVQFSGEFRQDEHSEWMPFTSAQFNFTDVSTRLFFMSASMKHLPVAGYHAYKNGKASMDIRLLSLFQVQYHAGNEMNITETVTFFNDMVCLAPATLIDKRITWSKVEGNKVNAFFTVGDKTISASLYFNDKGELINFISDDRYATLPDGTMKKFTWSTPIHAYKKINGFNLPAEADVIYAYPKGDFCYGKFTTQNVKYNVHKVK